MKGNWSIEPDDDEDFEFLPPDIDTELGYDGTGQLWKCNHHSPIHGRYYFHPKISHVAYFCCNCSFRKNCPDGDVDTVSQNYDLIQLWYED